MSNPPQIIEVSTSVDLTPPAPPKTYLDYILYKLFLAELEKTSDTHYSKYKRLMLPFLDCMFPKEQQYSTHYERLYEEKQSEWCVLIFLTPPGCQPRAWHFLLTQCKGLDVTWEAAEEEFRGCLANSMAESKNLYGMLQVGPHVRFFKYEDGEVTDLGPKMHVVDDVKDVVALGQYMRDHPLSVL